MWKINNLCYKLCNHLRLELFDAHNFMILFYVSKSSWHGNNAKFCFQISIKFDFDTKILSVQYKIRINIKNTTER